MINKQTAPRRGDLLDITSTAWKIWLLLRRNYNVRLRSPLFKYLLDGNFWNLMIINKPHNSDAQASFEKSTAPDDTLVSGRNVEKLYDTVIPSHGQEKYCEET